MNRFEKIKRAMGAFLQMNPAGLYLVSANEPADTIEPRDAHGGRLFADTNGPDPGLTFLIELPAQIVEAHAG